MDEAAIEDLATRRVKTKRDKSTFIAALGGSPLGPPTADGY